jgi:hypothetical protein
VKWDSAPSDLAKDLRASWLNTDLKDKIKWTQGSEEVNVTLKVRKQPALSFRACIGVTKSDQKRDQKCFP